jgi:hypothetical protein
MIANILNVESMIMNLFFLKRQTNASYNVQMEQSIIEMFSSI